MTAVPLTTFSPLLSQMPEFSRSPTREVTRDYDKWVWNELSPTDVQREQIDQITVSNEQSTKAILRNVLTAKLALQDAIIKNSSGEGPIRSLSTGLGYAMTELCATSPNLLGDRAIFDSSATAAAKSVCKKTGDFARGQHRTP